MQEYAILDILQVYEWISADERALLSGRQDYQGEKASIIWGDANYDLITVNLMIDEAFDKGVDILVTLSTPVTQVAVNTTLDQDAPTPVLFSAVFEAFRAGIADAHCIKPDHVTGSQNAPPYDEALRLFLLQNPDMKRVGTIYSLTDGSGTAGAPTNSRRPMRHFCRACNVHRR
ncbi:MAG: ABC transporter substrate binding protein [Chloroflexi bacterium]|nr:ABC transporter substrate binding protein [Chloroflexota bacterium]